MTQLKEQGKRILCLWDGSVVEKAESEKSEGLCPVLGSQSEAARAHQTRSRVQLARSPPRAGHGDAMERGTDRRDGRGCSPGSDALVDAASGSLRRNCERPKKSCCASRSENGVLCSCMCLIEDMHRDIGSRSSGSIERVLSFVGSKIRRHPEFCVKKHLLDLAHLSTKRVASPTQDGRSESRVCDAGDTLEKRRYS